jgi:NADH-quinone oxidoreductase subunit L
VHAGHGVSYWLPLSVLLVFSTFLGGMIHPPLAGVLPPGPGDEAIGPKHEIALLSSAVGISGIALAGLLFLGERRFTKWLAATPPFSLLGRWWRAAFGFDWLYDLLFVRPFVWFTHANINDGVDQAILAIPAALGGLNKLATRTQTGQLRWYAVSVAAGAVVVMAAALWLK